MNDGTLLVTAAEQIRIDVHEGGDCKFDRHQRLGLFSLAVAALLEHAAAELENRGSWEKANRWPPVYELVVARAYLGISHVQIPPDLDDTVVCGPITTPLDVPSASSVTATNTTAGSATGSSERVHGAEGARRRASIIVDERWLHQLLQLPDELSIKSVDARNNPVLVELVVEGGPLEETPIDSAAPILRPTGELRGVQDDGTTFHRVEWGLPC